MPAFSLDLNLWYPINYYLLIKKKTKKMDRSPELKLANFKTDTLLKNSLQDTWIEFEIKTSLPTPVNKALFLEQLKILDLDFKTTDNLNHAVDQWPIFFESCTSKLRMYLQISACIAALTHSEKVAVTIKENKLTIRGITSSVNAFFLKAEQRLRDHGHSLDRRVLRFSISSLDPENKEHTAFQNDSSSEEDTAFQNVVSSEEDTYGIELQSRKNKTPKMIFLGSKRTTTASYTLSWHLASEIETFTLVSRLREAQV